MAITKIQSGALPADVITTAAIDDASVTHAKLHATMDLSGKTVTLPTLSTLNTTGNVGIGTSSPARQLSIVDDGTNGQAMMEVLDSTNNNVSGIFLGRADNTNIGGMRYFHATDHLALRSNDVDALIINSTGNVGIGTSSPSHNLHVSSSSGSALALTAGSTENAQIRFGDSSDDDAGKINYDNSSNHMALHTNAAERMRIDASGDIFIGTSSDVAPANGTNLYISDGTISRFGLEKTGTNARKFSINNGGTYFSVYDETADAERMRIDSTGMSTFSDITVGGVGDSQALIQMIANPTNGATTIHFGDATSGAASYDGYIQYAHDSRTMQFSVGGAESMRILRDDGTNDGLVKVKGGLGLNFSSSLDASQYMMGVGTDNSYRSGVIFELETSQGLWACGFIKIKCAAGRNGLESRSAAEYLYKFQAFNEGISGIGLVSSAGNTGDFTISVTEANANSSTGTVELKVKSTASTNHGTSLTYVECGHYNGITRVRRGI